MRKIIAITLWTISVAIPFLSYAQPVRQKPAGKVFVHPGIAQSREDLEFLKRKVLAGEQPWKDAFDRLKKATDTTFKPQPFTHISVGAYGANGRGGTELFKSANASYDNALLWYITGNRVYADKAIEILNAWSPVLWDFDDNNAKLNVGLTAYYFLNAAEILKYTASGWKPEAMEQFKRMILTVYYPTIKDFFTEANGNWDASMINAMLCIGVFTDNQAIFNRAVERFYHGPNNSGITKYIYPSGQIQETTRDWGHVQLGLGEFEKAAQVAWTQGIDFYSAAGNRLALGYEYAAKYMLGGDVPVYGLISARERGKYRDIYESIYQHYRSIGIEMPYTAQVIREQTRPKSSTALLSSTRNTRNTPVMRTTVLDTPSNIILRAGALASVTMQPADGAIRVAPGDSIQAALEKSLVKGKWVILTKGVHRLKSPLRIPSGVTLSGEGKESILMLSPGLNGIVIVGADVRLHDVTIRDLLIEGGAVTGPEFDPNDGRRMRSYMNAPSRGGISFTADQDDQMQNIRLEHLTVQNCTKNGVYIGGAANVLIKDCDFSGNGSSVVPGAGLMHNLYLAHTSQVEVTGSRFDSSPWGSGINLCFCREVNVSGNESCRNKLSGIACSESNQVSVTRNLLEGNDGYGIRFDSLMDKCRQVIVTSNVAQYNGEPGISADKIVNGKIADNTEMANGK
jgi:hypothetical protein